MYRFFKRACDFIISLLAIIILSPLLLIIALAVKLTSKGPVVFKQQRIGMNGKVFNILKYRSMVVGAESKGTGVYSGKNDKRVTKIGKILRATSLDELLQLFNILRGDMSIIGPRPPLTYHPWPYEEYTEEQKKMFNVRPGVTGWAQVNGRKEVEWHKRIELNVWYVEHISFALDVKIFFMTIGKVFKNSNNENKGATLSKRQPLKLMYITNDEQVALIADENGVDRIFIDMETIGKDERQKGRDTVKSHHVLSDIKVVKKVVKKAQIIARINPIHNANGQPFDENNPYTYSSEYEIDKAIENGADIIMLPMWKSAEEVEKFISLINKRAKTMLLLETAQAKDNLDKVLELSGIDEIHIGLNDLHLSMNKKFMFELLADGTVESITEKIKAKGIPYGIGGVGAIGKGAIPAEVILGEHYRLGSSFAILSRTFCNTAEVTDKQEIAKIFADGLKEFREKESEIATWTPDRFEQNRKELGDLVKKFLEEK